jgi:hypothetical protein
MISADTRARNPGASHFHGRRDCLTSLVPTAPMAIARTVIIAVIIATPVLAMAIGDAFPRRRRRPPCDGGRTRKGRGGAQRRTPRAAPRLFASPRRAPSAPSAWSALAA